MTERDTFLRTIADAWDDPTPVLVFADWAEEHGTDNPALLRWYGWHVMPAVAAVPPKCRRASNGDRDRAGKSVGSHPQADVLLRYAAVAFCRRPSVWDGEGKEIIRPAVALCRLLSLGLGHDVIRSREFRRANAAANTLSPQVETAYVASQLDLVNELADRMRVNLLAADLHAERPRVARASVASRTVIAVAPPQRAAERGWQLAVYEALARVPPLVIDEGRPPVVEAVRELEKKNLPPMKLPRGKFRRIVVRGRAYGWQATYDEILVRSADNTGQRLLVRPALRIVRPGLVARIIADALDGGWTPTMHGLPDFVWDGNPYLV